MNSAYLISAVGLGIAVLAAGCGGSSDPPARAATSADPPARTAQVDLPAGRIAFRRYLGDAQTQGAIFVMRTDGSGERQLTDPQGGATDDYPDWSRDGRLIAFQRCHPDSPCSVWTVGADGGEAQQVRSQCHLKWDCERPNRRGRPTAISSSHSPRAACANSTAGRRSS